MHTTIELEDKDFDKLVQFISTETLRAELAKRMDALHSLAAPEPAQPAPEAPKRKAGRPKQIKEESREIDFGAEDGAEEPAEKDVATKVYSREDVVTALNAYANNGGGLAAGKAKIKEFCGTEKLADIPVNRYGEFIKSLEANG